MSKKDDEKVVKEVKQKSGKKNTSLRLDKPTLKALKIKAIEKDTSVQALIEGLISDYLKQEKKNS